MKEGITKDIINYIQSYPKCNTEKSLKPVKAPIKVLVEDGLHFKIENGFILFKWWYFQSM